MAFRVGIVGPGMTVTPHARSLIDLKVEAAYAFSPSAARADPMAFPHDWHRSLLADFLDAAEKNRQPRVSGEEALKVHRFIDKLLAAG